MKDWTVDEWTGCYPSKWKGMVVPEAITHPAKFSSRLIRRIYEHMIAEGWLKAGDIVLDPFGGVALGALDAMRLGLRWRGIELEARFADLGDKNIRLWNGKFGQMPNWCRDAVLVQGDSRHLIEVLQGADTAVTSPPYTSDALGHGESQIDISKSKHDFGPNSQAKSPMSYGGTVGSPPYADGAQHQGGDSPTSLEFMSEKQLRTLGMSGSVASPPYSEARIGQESGQEHAGRGDQYGPTPGQLGAMPATGLDAALTSPPYNPPMSQDHNGSRGGERGVTPSEPGAFVRYGNTDGQLEGMSMSGLDAALASPPYTGNVQVEKNAKSVDLRKQWETYRHSGGMSYEEFAAYQTKMSQGYGHADGQLADMPEGKLDAAITSPPFRQAQGGTPEPKPGGVIDAGLYQRHAAGNSSAEGYGATDGQLANMAEGEIEAALSSPPYEATQIASIPGSGTDVVLRKKLRASGVWEGYNRENPDNLGSSAGDDFWMAARQIVDQVYAVLRPGGHAVWVVKGFVKNKQLVDFPGQWRQLCEAAGFTMVHEHHAMLVHDKGTSHTLDGGTVHHQTESKSFFRRLAESKGAPRIDFETVLCMVKGVE